MKKLLLTALLLTSSSALFAEGRFYVGGSWGYGAPGPIRAYAPPPPPPVYGYGYGYGYRNAYVRPPCPGPDYVWIDGYYDYYGRGYNWRPGYWGRRPHHRAVWVAPRWHRGNYFVGYWRR